MYKCISQHSKDILGGLRNVFRPYVRSNSYRVWDHHNWHKPKLKLLKGDLSASLLFAGCVKFYKACGYSVRTIVDVFVQGTERLQIISVFSKQCNAIAAQRIRRSAQICNLYSRLYNFDKNNLKAVLQRLCRTFLTLAQKGRDKRFFVLFGAAFFSWNEEAVTDEQLEVCASEIGRVEHVREHLNGNGNGVDPLPGWEKLIDRPNLLGWRRPVEGHSYLYEYKMYGTFHDLPARAFFNVQVDLDYRKKWDSFAIKLDVIEKDKKTGSEVICWVLKYPYPMYSRDYVYVRRYKVFPESKLMVLVSRATSHPTCPPTKEYVRVETYQSHMVIKPHCSFDENGFDFMLTYYDDAKAPFPSAAYNWMASTGVPGFVERMHSAAMELHKKRRGPIQIEQSIQSEKKPQSEYATM